MSDIEGMTPPDGVVEPNAGERANGWTAESLTTYLQQRDRERARAMAGFGLSSSPVVPPRCDGRYDPWTW